MSKKLYGEKHSRYEYRLTQKGLDLYPILMAVVQWGDLWVFDQDGSPIIIKHAPCEHIMHPKYVIADI